MLMSRFTSALLAVAALASVAGAQNPTTPPADVVVLALEERDSADSFLRAAFQLVGRKAETATLRDVQMDIVRKTAPFGPVLLLATDDESLARMNTNCASFEMCDLLANGRVRIAVVPHDSGRIRDYGPFIEQLPSGKARVVDSA